ncbi:cell envelope integrity protein TolA, partial [Acidithiobacillus ferridurans]|nr:cell envelope integrity protein TolA [Acidithiobacillus ferridurans]
MKKRKSAWPLVLAIVLNGAILLALFWSYHINVPEAGGTPMQAQLSSGMQAAPAPQPVPKPAPVPQPAPAPVPKPAP